MALEPVRTALMSLPGLRGGSWAVGLSKEFESFVHLGYLYSRTPYICRRPIGGLVDGQSIALLLINLLGGAAVIGSYVLGLRGGPGGSSALWGGVSERVRPVYAVSMVLSAVGYLAVLFLIFFRLDPVEVTIAGRSGFALLYPIFLLILIPSAAWMPLTRRYVSEPRMGTWIAVRVVLLVVGVASIALAWALLTLEPDNHGAAYWLAVAGSSYFAFHTFVLDAILWAALFRRRP
jgi:hypothetical protein